MSTIIIMVLLHRFCQSRWWVERRRNQQWSNMQECMRRSQYDDYKNDDKYIALLIWLTMLAHADANFQWQSGDEQVQHPEHALPEDNNFQYVSVFSCPGSSIPDIGQSVSQSLTHCHFRTFNT